MERKMWLSGLIRSKERKNVFAHKNLGYILPKERRGMIYMIGQQVQKYLDKGETEESWYYPHHGVWIINQETFSIALPMFLLIYRVP